jgi:hypothetical protein
MNRTTLLQDRRMLKFEELLKRWHDGELSGAEAGQYWGCSERQVPPLPAAQREGRPGRPGRPPLGKGACQARLSSLNPAACRSWPVWVPLGG